jgi:hypothetical protein
MKLTFLGMVAIIGVLAIVIYVVTRHLDTLVEDN